MTKSKLKRLQNRFISIEDNISNIKTRFLKLQQIYMRKISREASMTGKRFCRNDVEKIN